MEMPNRELRPCKISEEADTSYIGFHHGSTFGSNLYVITLHAFIAIISPLSQVLNFLVK